MTSGLSTSSEEGLQQLVLRFRPLKYRISRQLDRPAPYVFVEFGKAGLYLLFDTVRRSAGSDGKEVRWSGYPKLSVTPT